MIGGAVFTGWSWRASGRAPAQEEPAPEDVGAVLSLSASQEDMSVLLRCLAVRRKVTGRGRGPAGHGGSDAVGWEKQLFTRIMKGRCLEYFKQMTTQSGISATKITLITVESRL